MIDNAANQKVVNFTLNKGFLVDLYSKMLAFVCELFPTLSVQRKTEMIHNIKAVRLATFLRCEDAAVNVDLFANEKMTARFSVSPRNEIFDFVPIEKNGVLLSIDPVILLDRNACLYTIIHELVHLLSLGGYYSLEAGVIYHRFGLFSYQYKIENGQLIKRFCNEERQTENENATNAFTELFLARLTENPVIDCKTGFQKNREVFGQYFNVLQNDPGRLFF